MISLWICPFYIAVYVTFFKKLSQIKYRFLVDLFSIILNPKYPVKRFQYIKNSPRKYYTLADPLLYMMTRSKWKYYFIPLAVAVTIIGQLNANHHYLLSKGEKNFFTKTNVEICFKISQVTIFLSLF